jgi:hypothetical protein
VYALMALMEGDFAFRSFTQTKFPLGLGCGMLWLSLVQVLSVSLPPVVAVHVCDRRCAPSVTPSPLPSPQHLYSIARFAFYCCYCHQSQLSPVVAAVSSVALHDAVVPAVSGAASRLLCAGAHRKDIRA